MNSKILRGLFRKSLVYNKYNNNKCYVRIETHTTVKYHHRSFSHFQANFHEGCSAINNVIIVCAFTENFK